MELLYTKIFIKNFHIDWMTFLLTKEHACSGFVFGFVLCVGGFCFLFLILFLVVFVCFAASHILG